MRRYDITEGDRTTAGGTVQRGNSLDILHGRAQAYDGDPVWCPQCNTMGKIACSGPRMPTKGPDGRETALSDDACVCQCHPSPRLVASQTISYVDV